MSYCLNPACPKPDNTNNGKFCLACGSKLLLKERYRALQPIGQGGFGRTFLAVDEDKPSKPRCVIKQFYPQAQGTSTLQKAEELFIQEATRLDDLGKNPQIPELLAYFTQDNRQYLVQEFIDGQNLEQELSQNDVFSETKFCSCSTTYYQYYNFAIQDKLFTAILNQKTLFVDRLKEILFSLILVLLKLRHIQV
jgi:DNA-directed RNA polymerase subunit RPC12/RpoP